MEDMMIWSVLYRTLRFLNVCAVYYVVQLGKCAMIAAAVLAVILFLRRSLFGRTVFLKGALWCLLVPVSFIGKLRFFYETKAGVHLFVWWDGLCMRHPWICWLYLAGMLAAAWRLLIKRKQMEALLSTMPVREVADTQVIVARLPVTPFTTGVFRPKIVLPELFLEQCTEDEVKLIILHEKIHIRSGHLAVLFLWDVGRVLLWPVLFPAYFLGFLQEDLEEMCDKSVIGQGQILADGYGSLLIKSILLLKEADPASFHASAAFAGDRAYRRMKARIEKILRYRPYRQGWARAFGLTAVIATIGMIGLAGKLSYARCNPMEGVTLWDLDTVEGIVEDSALLEGIVHYDDRYVYVDTAALQEVVDLDVYEGHEVVFVFGGFYKLPGIGGCCDGAYINVRDLTEEQADGICRVSYESPFDLWAWILARI